MTKATGPGLAEFPDDRFKRQSGKTVVRPKTPLAILLLELRELLLQDACDDFRKYRIGDALYSPDSKKALLVDRKRLNSAAMNLFFEVVHGSLPCSV
jgi:hypothetical protein